MVIGSRFVIIETGEIPDIVTYTGLEFPLLVTQPVRAKRAQVTFR